MDRATNTDLDWSGLEILSSAHCWQQLDATPVARVGFVDQGSPVVLPVNIAVDRGTVVFRTAAGSKLAAAMLNRPVCIEADDWDVMAHTGWSVLAKGIADHVLDPAETERLGALPVAPWTRPDLRSEWVRVLVDELSGRRIRHESSFEG